MDHLPLERVVLLIDRSTDRALLTQTLESVWAGMNPGPPNRQAAAGRVSVIDLTRGYPRAVRRLMQIGEEVLAKADFTSDVEEKRLAPAPPERTSRFAWTYSAAGGGAQTCSY
jgi:hypothetical protein